MIGSIGAVCDHDRRGRVAVRQAASAAQRACRRTPRWASRRKADVSTPAWAAPRAWHASTVPQSHPRTLPPTGRARAALPAASGAGNVRVARASRAWRGNRPCPLRGSAGGRPPSRSPSSRRSAGAVRSDRPFRSRATCARRCSHRAPASGNPSAPGRSCRRACASTPLRRWWRCRIPGRARSTGVARRAG